MKKKRSPMKKSKKKPSFWKSLSEEQKREVKGLSLTLLSLFLLISLISVSRLSSYLFPLESPLGSLGNYTAFFTLALFGISSYLVVGLMGWAGIYLLLGKKIENIFEKGCFFFLFLASFSFIFSLAETESVFLKELLGKAFLESLWIKKQFLHLGGAFFYYFYADIPNFNLLTLFSPIGTFFLSLLALCFSLCYFLKKKPEELLLQFCKKVASVLSLAFQKKEAPLLVKVREEKEALTPLNGSLSKTAFFNDIENDIRISGISEKEKPFERKEEKPPLLPPKTMPKEPQRDSIASKPLGDCSNYVLPPFSLITPAKKVDQSSLKKDLKEQAKVLEETLLSFGIEAKVGQVNVGPTITSFEVHPAIGVKVQKIKALENDIALNMQAKSIRIIAPIPGKAAVGIEIPSPIQEEVGFKDLLINYQETQKKLALPLLLGKAVNGEIVMADLAKMPHCIIAGATGSGKSVCINTIIMSILFNFKPDEVKFLMIDPKKVELTPYTLLPHMLSPVITEPSGASNALNFLVKEMEKRYELLKVLGHRNIISFNERDLSKDTLLALETSIEIPEKLPYIVAIIDELADLMMVAGNEIEGPIARIAQMARAVGIHLILATQRPSREVITGLIKANFPTRISFKVASRINSQIILDETGAESLLGNGDMLFLPPGTSHLTRAQGAYIRDEDISKVIDFILKQKGPSYVIPSFDKLYFDEPSLFNAPPSGGDALYKEALDIILNTGSASTTFLQRKLKIGYARAASLMDELEEKGVVSGSDGSKPRKILIAHHKGGVDKEFSEE